MMEVVLLLITYGCNSFQCVYYWINASDVCLFTESLLSMCDDFSAFLMASVLVYNYLASANQIYTFSRMGQLPSNRDEFKMKRFFIAISVFGIITCLVFLFLSNYFYFTDNLHAL